MQVERCCVLVFRVHDHGHDGNLGPRCALQTVEQKGSSQALTLIRDINCEAAHANRGNSAVAGQFLARAFRQTQQRPPAVANV